MASDTRDRILHAMRALLARGGASVVTLESVAAEAGLSKGGLLYHFPNKEALYAGLLDEASRSVGDTMTELTARRGPVQAYLDYALPETELEAAYFTALIAAVRADDSVGAGADARLIEIFRRWEAPLLAAVADPVLAQTIRLVGLGLYLGAVAGLPTPAPDVMTALFDRLVAQAQVAHAVHVVGQLARPADRAPSLS